MATTFQIDQPIKLGEPFYLVFGSKAEFDIVFEDDQEPPQPIDLTGKDVIVTLSSHYDQAVHLTVDGQITIPAPATGRATCVLSEALALGLTWHVGRYDLYVVDTGQDTDRCHEGGGPLYVQQRGHPTHGQNSA